jgi:hypothetical protein
MEEEWVSCWKCMGDGGWHDCGEDTCCCDPVDLDVTVCEVCDGEGGWDAET